MCKVARQAAWGLVATLALSCLPIDSRADGGPFGIDHRWSTRDSGVWKRRNQVFLEDATILVVVGGALWNGSDSRIGHSFWQSVDSVAIGAVTSESMKRIFSRTRPSETDNPNQWFRGGGSRSFPSGEVMEIASAVAPFVFEYGPESPAVYALELLPLYDAIARVKVRGHWQSDVLASWVIGTGIGYYAHQRTTALSVGLLPRGITVGWKHSF